MIAPDTGGQAFPCVLEYKNPGAGSKTYATPGMTLRDYFAARALSGSANYAAERNCKPEDVAKAAYAMADAILEARK